MASGGLVPGPQASHQALGGLAPGPRASHRGGGGGLARGPERATEAGPPGPGAPSEPPRQGGPPGPGAPSEPPRQAPLAPGPRASHRGRPPPWPRGPGSGHSVDNDGKKGVHCAKQFQMGQTLSKLAHRMQDGCHWYLFAKFGLKWGLLDPFLGTFLDIFGPSKNSVF